MRSEFIHAAHVRYNEDALILFDEFQWLFKYPVTELLLRNSLNSIPNDWLVALRKLNYQELNQFVIGKLSKSDWPDSLNFFLKRCKELNTLTRQVEIDASGIDSLPRNLCLGLSPKKQHEVSHLVRFIHVKCKAENIHTIVDFGCGLGYICQALHQLYGYQVFGLESNHEIYKNACRRQLELFPESCDAVKYLYREVNIEDDNDNWKFINDNIILPNGLLKKICVIGLHSCGELGVTSGMAFTKIPQCGLLIMISCCYHKLEVCENNEIKSFGLSNHLRSSIVKYDAKKKLNLNNSEKNVKKIFNRPFMRLACQEPAIRWQQMSDEDHNQHALCVLLRAVLELFVHENNIVLKKCVKKATRKSQCTDFETYLTDTLQRFTFNGENVSNNEELIGKIRNLWNENKEKLQDIEIFTALQSLLQAPAESLVLEDRRWWLLEYPMLGDASDVKILPVFSSNLSPRCQAIVARKDI